MAIPDFNEYGLLPEGDWRCSEADIRARLCWNDHRTYLWQLFTRFRTDHLNGGLLLPAPLILAGSFVRSKPLPDDIDLCIDLRRAGQPSKLRMFELYATAKDEIAEKYRIDLNLYHPEAKKNLPEFFRYAGTKCAVEQNIAPHFPHGVLRLAL